VKTATNLHFKKKVDGFTHTLTLLGRSTNDTESIRLDPVVTDFERMCGSKLEFQILPGATGGKKTVIEITAENVDDSVGYDSGINADEAIEKSISSVDKWAKSLLFVGKVGFHSKD